MSFLFVSQIQVKTRTATHEKISEFLICIELIICLNLFRVGCFGAAHGCGGAKRPLLHKICHIYPAMMKLSTVTPYLKKVQTIYESRDAPLEFSWNQHFFTRNQQILLYQEIQIQIAIWYTISYSFDFSWVFKDCSNKHGYNFLSS